MKPLALAPLALLAATTSAQNLVNNGSFEDYYACPTGWGQWMQVVDWSSPYTTSADYFNACTGDDVAGVPFNQFGYQSAADGDAYMGLATYLEATPWYREMIATELNEPLQIGVPLCLSFKVAVGGYGSWDGNSARYTNKGVGVKFFTELPTDWGSYLYPNSAALYLDMVPTDTAIWYSVIGTYIPDSAYTHMVIANFFADSLCDVVLLDTAGIGNWNTAYAFIDDVRVSYDLNFCGQATGVPSPRDLISAVYPNPFAEHVEVLFPNVPLGLVHMQLFNGRGEMVSSSTRAGANSIALEYHGLADGPYLLRILDAGGGYQSVPLVHVSP